MPIVFPTPATPSSASTGDMELIFFDEVTSGTQANFSTGTLQSGYSAYRINIKGRTDVNNILEDLIVYFNGDNSISNYGQRRLLYGPTNAVTTATGTTADNFFAVCSGGTAGANEFCQSVIDIVSPEMTTGFKTWSMKTNNIVDYGTNTTRFGQHNVGFWKSTAAITSFQLIPRNSGSLVTGSSIHVYGLK